MLPGLGQEKARESDKRRCLWPGCTKLVPCSMWGCRVHWYQLPVQIRNAIWNAYRPGQERDLRIGKAYVEAAKAAQDWIRDHGPAADE